MVSIDKVIKEAAMFRTLLEKCDKNITSLVIDSFPVMSCKLSSMLLCYHFLRLWPDLVIKGVSGLAVQNHKVSHYWIEIDDMVVDITGDQYNIIDDIELNSVIIQSRPFPALHVTKKRDSYLYSLFEIQERNYFTCGFPTLGKDFIEEIEHGYNQLLSHNY